MSQRSSGYARKRDDDYSTPAWVTRAVLPHLGEKLCVLEPAAGTGKMVAALHKAGYNVVIDRDFLTMRKANGIDAIMTNPPYNQAQKFIEHALMLMRPTAGKVAMLLRTDYDHAVSRQHLFGDCPQFAKKLVLTKRIVWFEPKVASPSFNHAWFIWDWRHSGPPILAYDIQP